MNPNLPIIVGESNPYGADPHFALYPEPDGCAGWRLCYKVMGLRRGTYMSSFERVNLLQGPKWSAPRAREAAGELLMNSGSLVWILLGRKVSEAFHFLGHRPPECREWISIPLAERILNFPNRSAVLLPHPSGRCRAWQDPTMVKTCRELLRKALPGISFGEVDELPMPKEQLGSAGVPGVHFEIKFEELPLTMNECCDLLNFCKSCMNEPDYRGPCDCAHAPCVHQQPTVTRTE